MQCTNTCSDFPYPSIRRRRKRRKSFVMCLRLITKFLFLQTEILFIRQWCSRCHKRAESKITYRRGDHTLTSWEYLNIYMEYLNLWQLRSQRFRRQAFSCLRRLELFVFEWDLIIGSRCMGHFLSDVTGKYDISRSMASPANVKSLMKAITAIDV